MATIPPSPQFSPPVLGEPAWDIARLYPGQGYWDERDYLDLATKSNQLVEYSDGFIEVLPMPTIEHQLIVRFLLDMLRVFVEPKKLGWCCSPRCPCRRVRRARWPRPRVRERR